MVSIARILNQNIIDTCIQNMYLQNMYCIHVSLVSYVFIISLVFYTILYFIAFCYFVMWNTFYCKNDIIHSKNNKNKIKIIITNFNFQKLSGSKFSLLCGIARIFDDLFNSEKKYLTRKRNTTLSVQRSAQL